MKLFSPQSAREKRLLHKGILGNAMNVMGDSWDVHVRTPVGRGKFGKAAVGVPLTFIDTVMNAPDAAVAGAFGEDITPLEARRGDRTRRDVAIVANQTIDALGNALTLHPIKAIGNVARGGLSAMRIVGGDLPMDALDAVGGYDVIDRAQRQRNATTADMNHTLTLAP